MKYKQRHNAHTVDLFCLLDTEVKDVVHPVLYLLSEYADMINGITLPVDGGYLAS